MSSPMDYIWDEVEAIQRLGEDAYNEVINAPVVAIQDIMQKLNEQVNGSYPIDQEFMKRSIRGEGNAVYAIDSPIAKAIAASPEFKELVADLASSSIQTVIKFRSDPNLSRSIYDGTIAGALDVVEPSFKFKGGLTDTYDFRYDWLPKSWTWKGVTLRLAGNIAKACTDLGLMKPYDVSVALDISGSKKS